MHTYRNPQDRSQGDHIRPDMTVGYGTVICTPMRHHRINIPEMVLFRSVLGTNQVVGQVGSVRLSSIVMNLLRQLNSPSFCNLHYGPNPFTRFILVIVTGIWASSRELGRISTTSEILSFARTPACVFKTFIYLFP